MAANLKDHFPIIRKREEILSEIKKNSILQSKFDSWEETMQKEFLDLCSGVKGLKLLYDGFFKEIMNPEYVPERLNDFLSSVLGQEIKVLKVLPADSVRISDESSLLIMDIVIELEDGSIANLEIQKIGYLFPGQRSACYSADLLLRQYRRVRNEITFSNTKGTGKKKKFNYRNIKSVFTIVLFEKSPKEFHSLPNDYYHFFEQQSNTGLKLELLQKYLFIPLDIFQKNKQNIDINEKRDAWLTLFSSDNPDDIIELIEKYPDFRRIYEEGYQICLNIEGVMDMFSEELYELDKNTVEYMIDEMQETVDRQKQIIAENEHAIDEQKRMINQYEHTINEYDQTISVYNQTISEYDQTISECNQTINERNQTISECNQTISELQDTIHQMKEVQEQAIRGTVAILRNLKLSEPEIIAQICSQYQLSEKEVQDYL